MTKYAKDWSDMIGSSEMPEDDLTFTEGSNYGLDGFSFSQPMGEGVAQGARLPQTQGLSGLPDGFVSDPDKSAALPDEDLSEVAWGVDLSAMLSEEEGAIPLEPSVREAASVVDLSWLDPTQEQDPSRLPKGLDIEEEDAVRSIPELVDAWGGGKATTGLELVPNTKDREVAKYQREIKEDQKSRLPGDRSASIREIVLRAMRQSHFGVPLSQIRREAAEALGHDAPRIREAMRAIEAEHGLAGKVFIRASAFPGIRNGKWVKELRRVAHSCRYVITDDPAVADKLKMEAVSQVPWKRAFRYYRPRLQAAGYNLSDDGDARATLKKAFLSGPVTPEVRSAPKPVATPPADLVSLEDAKRAFAEAPPSDREVVRAATREASIERRKALVQVARWVRRGLLSKEDAIRLRDSTAPTRALVKAAADLIVASGKTPEYKGAGAHQIPEHIKASPNRSETWRALRLAEKQAAEEEKERLRHLASTIHEAPEEDSEGLYKGPQFTALPYQPRQVRETSKIAGQVEKFVRQQMSEGLAGSALDVMIRSKFAKPVRTAAEDQLVQLRRRHEGLSGHLYVDAGAYMSPKGLSGCEEGALRHRANGLKYILAADRCGGCKHAADGRCKLYRKELVDAPPVENPKRYQAEMIRAADASDAEVVASLFSPSEFDLSSPLEDFEITEEASTEELGDILFGEVQV